MRNRSYRKIYENHKGPIPKDEKGRSYEIHHIDGNPENNVISNLIAVSIEEHYNIHKRQGDLGACWLMSARLLLDAEEMSRLGREMALRAGPRSDEWKRKQSESQKKRVRKPHSEETKLKISESNKARTSPNKGVAMSEENKQKRRKPKLNKENYRKPKSEEHKQKMREAAKLAWQKRRDSNSR